MATRGNNNKKLIWTPEARWLLYSQLVRRFGPLAGWNGKPDGYDAFCSHFAEIMAASSAEAVNMQIRFAFPVKRKAHWKQGHAHNAILNLAAALQAGFILFSDLPDLEATPAAKQKRRHRPGKGDGAVTLKGNGAVTLPAA